MRINNIVAPDRLGAHATLETETGGSQVAGQSGLYSKCQNK
jgi:hypothetical protein